MTVETQIAVTAALALLAGLLLAWLVMRRSVHRAYQQGKDAAHPEIQRLTDLVESLQIEIRQSASEKSELEKRLAVAEHANEAISGLKSDLAAGAAREHTLQQEIRQIGSRLAQEKERAARVEMLEKRLEQREQANTELMEGITTREVAISELKTRMTEERKRAEEKLALLDAAKAELTQQFQVLAQEILEQKGRVFSEQSQSHLKNLLDPFRDQLNEFKQKVDSVYVHEAKDRASLKKEIETLRDLNLQISQEAVNLTRALKGDKKAQGTWGELILERVLEQSGLRKGVEYETQGGFRDANGRLLKPDVIVHLPESKDVVIDSKVSLVAYERYAAADTDAEQARCLREHIRAVRAHIDGLSEKDYAAVKGIRSLDFVLMFMPIEAAFMAAFRADENLFSHAFEKRIVVVTPTTLLATLKTIENIWRYERQNKSAQAIFARASAIYDKLRLFVESMEKLGKQIDTVQGTYEEAMKRLVRGKGNVISQASQFSALGVPIKRQIPATITEISEIEGDAEKGTDPDTTQDN